MENGNDKKGGVKFEQLVEANSKLVDDMVKVQDFGFYAHGLSYLEKKYQNSDLDWYLLDELKSGKKLSKSEIARRKEFYVMLSVSDETRVYTEDEARQILEKEGFSEQSVDIEEIRGMSAYRGSAVGEVVVVWKEGDFQSKNIDGKVLVTPVTTPQFTPYMKKVIGLVTDEGGITSHSAITAREIKIPTVIGTNIATDVFKDGDMIEVDADNGIVRKL